MFQVRVDRHRCIGIGNCIALAPTAFDWFPGELLKADVVDPSSVDEELIRQGRLRPLTDPRALELAKRSAGAPGDRVRRDPATLLELLLSAGSE